MYRLQVSMQRQETSGYQRKDAPQENRLNNYIRSKLASENYLKIILMCLVLYCDLVDFWDWRHQHFATCS